MRIQNLIPVLCLILVHSVGASALAVERPNIIFLFADDQRADTIGAHGNPLAEPINKLPFPFDFTSLKTIRELTTVF